ncbi:MAG: hypothetical protein QXN35_05895, partial [Ignisphaera sp.]
EHFENIVGANATRDLEKLIDYVEEGSMEIYEALNRIKSVVDAVQSATSIQSLAGLNTSTDLALITSVQ